MKQKSSLINLSLLLVILSEILMIFFEPTGLNFFKIATISLLWFSILVIIQNFLKNYKKSSSNYPKFALFIVWLIIFWSIINALRAIIEGQESLATTFGNKYTILALFVPFIVFFPINKLNVTIVNRFLFRSIMIGIILFVPLSLISYQYSDLTMLKVIKLILLPVTLLITTFDSQVKNKLIIIIAVILLFIVSYDISERAMLLRILLLVIGLIALKIYKKFNFKWILKFSFLIIFLPTIIISSILTPGEENIIEKGINTFDFEDNADTRTFLYLEVFEDLIKNDQLIFGKGANGKYYSPYFNSQKGSRNYRITVEVGILFILLKSGLIGLLLYLILIFTSIYYSFFKSNNLYVKGVGYILLVYLFLLFVQNTPDYTFSTLIIWFFIGICLSKEIRNMNDIEIKSLLLNKQTS